MNKHNLNDLAEALVGLHDEDNKLDIRCVELAQRYSGKRYPLESTVTDIVQNHRQIIEVAHFKATYLNCMPTAVNYFDEGFYLVEDQSTMEKAEIDRCLPLGYGKIVAGFRFSRGTNDILFTAWIKHPLRVSVGTAVSGAKQTARLNGNNHLPNPNAVSMIEPPKAAIIHALDTTMYVQPRLGNGKGKKAEVRVAWRTFAKGDTTIAKYNASIGYILANETAFAVQFEYFQKKYVGKLSPNIVTSIVKDEYAILLFRMHRANANTFFSKKDVFGDEEVYVRINKAIEREINKRK